MLSSFGEPVKNDVYTHLKNDFSISKNELPQNIQEFSNFLFRVFGSGARHLEIKFMQTLYAKISDGKNVKHKPIVFKEIDLTFLNYVNKIRDSFEISVY